jgi:hypothetical protein
MNSYLEVPGSTLTLTLNQRNKETKKTHDDEDLAAGTKAFQFAQAWLMSINLFINFIYI